MHKEKQLLGATHFQPSFDTGEIQEIHGRNTGETREKYRRYTGEIQQKHGSNTGETREKYRRYTGEIHKKHRRNIAETRRSG